MKARFDLTVSKPLIYRVLKQNFEMRYKRVKPIPWRGNSQRCMVLRALYGKKMIEELSKSQRVIHIDESWLPQVSRISSASTPGSKSWMAYARVYSETANVYYNDPPTSFVLTISHIVVRFQAHALATTRHNRLQPCEDSVTESQHDRRLRQLWQDLCGADVMQH